MKLQAGSDTVFSTTDHVEEGRALNSFWTDSLDLSTPVAGGANLLETENLQQGYVAAYSSLATGAHDAQSNGKWASWTSGLGDGLQQLGFRADAQSGLQKSWSGGVDGAVGPGGELGVVTAKVGVSGGWHRVSSDQTTTSQNLNTTTSQQIVESSLHHAIDEYEKVHGAGAASQASQTELAHRAAELAHDQFESLLKAASHETAASRGNNAALEEAGQVPPSVSVSNFRQSVQEGIEETRKKLGPGYVR